MSRTFIDALQSTPFRVASNMAAKILAVLQDDKVGEQLAGFGMTFLLLCRRFGVEPRVALMAAERMLREAERHNWADTRALARYLREELSE